MQLYSIPESWDQFLDLFLEFVSQIITIFINLTQPSTQTHQLAIHISNLVSYILINFDIEMFGECQQVRVVTNERLCAIEELCHFLSIFEEVNVLLYCQWIH